MAARNVSYLHLRRTAQINDRFSMYRRPAFGIHTSGTRNRRPSNRSRFCPKSLPLGGRVSAQGSRRRRTSDDRVRQENSVTKRLPGRRLFTRFRLFAASPERRQIDRQSRSTAPNMLDGTRHCSPKSSSDRMRDTDSRDGPKTGSTKRRPFTGTVSGTISNAGTERISTAGRSASTSGRPGAYG